MAMVIDSLEGVSRAHGALEVVVAEEVLGRRATELSLLALVVMDQLGGRMRWC